MPSFLIPLAKKSLVDGGSGKVTVANAFLYEGSKEKEKETLPDSPYKVAPLRPEHAPLLAKHWEYADSSTLDYVGHQIKHGLGIGAFKGEELVSWALIMK